MDSTKTQKPVWNPTCTRMTPQYESYSVCESDMTSGNGIRLNTSYSGIAITCCGSRLPAVNSTSSGSPPRMRTRVMANATNDARNSVSRTPGTAMIIVLTKYFGSPPFSHTVA